MLFIKKLLKMLLFAPLLPILGTTEGGDGESQGDDGSGDKSGVPGQSGNNDSTGRKDDTTTGGGEQKPDVKTFTQDEMTRRATAEKQQGRNSVLTELGFDPNDAEAVAKAKAILDAQRSDAEKKDIELKNEQAAKLEAQSKLEEAQRKLAVIEVGANPKYIDEVTALATARVNDTTDFAAALKSVKDKLPTFFGDDDDIGTGSSQGHGRGKKGTSGEVGKRLAESQKPQKTENPYFK